MRQLISALLVSLLVAGAARSQEAPKPTDAHPVVLVEATRAMSSNLGYTSLAGWLLFSPDEGQRVQAGPGLRGGHLFQAGAADYESQTPPAGELLRVRGARVVALNVAFHLRVRVVGPLRLGGNFDFVGLGFGPERMAQRSSTPPLLLTASRPALLNLARDGRASRGSLISEFYAALDLPRGLDARLGVARASAAYTIAGPGAERQRYRRRDTLLALGLSYQLR